jgi:hypothetical protein
MAGSAAPARAAAEDGPPQAPATRAAGVASPRDGGAVRARYRDHVLGVVPSRRPGCAPAAVPMPYVLAPPPPPPPGGCGGRLG